MSKLQIRYLWPFLLMGLLSLPVHPQPDSQEPWTLPPPPPQRPAGVKEMTLGQVLELGLAQNPQMRVAAERVEQARAAYLQSKSQKNPKLVLTNSTRLQPETAIDTGPLLGQP